MSTSEGGGSSSSKIVLIVLGIAGGLFVLCCGGGVVAFFAISMLGRSAQNTFTSVGNTIESPSGSGSQIATVGPEVEAQGFLTAINTGNISQAYTSYTTSSYRLANRETDLRMIINQNEALRQNRRCDFKTENKTSSQATLIGQIPKTGNPNGPFLPITLQMRVENGKWRVDRFTVG